MGLGHFLAALVGVVVGVSLATLVRLATTRWYERRHEPRDSL